MKESQFGSTRFHLHGFDGNIRATYDVTHSTVEGDAASKKSIGHHIMVVDRSGSMYGDIGALKDTIIRILTLDEYRGSDMLVSLVSYSSSGDVTVHFERTPLAKVMELDSKYIKEVRKIRATNMTCISQAMRVAEGLVRDEEATGITLHSDGYANDPSPSMERSTLMAICAKLGKRPVFINTVAYRENSDFILLSELASCASGTCVHATSTKQVDDAIQASTQAVFKATPPIDIPANGADIVVFVATDGSRKVVGGAGDLSVKGASKGTVYRYTKNTKLVNWNPEAAAVPYVAVALPLCRHWIATGNLNGAKYALLSSGVFDLFQKHYRALTANQVGEFAAAVDWALFDNPTLRFKPVDQMIPKCASVLEVCSAIDKNRDAIRIDIDALLGNYKRRSVKRVPGTRKDDGTIEEPPVNTQSSESGPIRINYFEFSRGAATINMNVAFKINLVDRKTGNQIREVAGITLDALREYRNYTIVGDGELCVPEFCLKFEKKTAFDALKALGTVEGDYKPGDFYVIELSGRPVSPFTVEISKVWEAINRAFSLKVVNGIVESITREKSTEYTPAQLDELAKHCLSKSLNVNFPTVNEYDDLKAAIAQGCVDTRTTYRVRIGTTKITSTDKFRSANEFLGRCYTLKKNGQTIEKPKMAVLAEGAVAEPKELGKKAKTTQADIIQKDIFDNALGRTGSNGLFVSACEQAGCQGLVDAVKRGGPALVKAAEEAKPKLAAYEDALWRENLCPLVFYVGSTGLIPDELRAKAMTAEEFEKAHPEASISKDEKEGMFFVFGETVITVYPETTYFSTGKQYEKATA